MAYHQSEIKSVLISAYRDHLSRGRNLVKIGDLLDGSYIKQKYADRQQQLQLAAEDLLDDQIRSEEELIERIGKVAERFAKARTAALKNTQLYLSMV